jgi:hypothetical protein
VDPLGRHVACHARESGHPVFAAALNSGLRNDKAAALALIPRFAPPLGLRPGQLFSRRSPHPALRATFSQREKGTLALKSGRR